MTFMEPYPVAVMVRVWAGCVWSGSGEWRHEGVAYSDELLHPLQFRRFNCARLTDWDGHLERV